MFPVHKFNQSTAQSSRRKVTFDDLEILSEGAKEQELENEERIAHERALVRKLQEQERKQKKLEKMERKKARAEIRE